MTQYQLRKRWGLGPRVDPHFDCAVGRVLVSPGSKEQVGTGYVELLGRKPDQPAYEYLAALIRTLHSPNRTRTQFGVAGRSGEQPKIWVKITALRYLTTDDATGISLPMASFNPRPSRGDDDADLLLAKLDRITQNKLRSAEWIGLTVDFSYEAAAKELEPVLDPGRFQRTFTSAQSQRNRVKHALFGGRVGRRGAPDGETFTFDAQDLATATGFSPQLGMAMRDLCQPSASHPADALDYGMAETGQGVIIGVVDFGCDFAHTSFRNGASSRILELWDQNDKPEPPFSTQPILSPGEACADVGGELCRFGYGRVFKRDHIELVLDKWLRERPGDRKAPYAMLGYDPTHNYFIEGGTGHGTHVLDICAGSRRGACVYPGIPPTPAVRGVAPRADIVFVQVRLHRQLDKRRILDANDVIDAVAYIFHVADKHERDCVVNLSLNTMSGPHDGDGHFERRLASILRSSGGAEVKGRAVVIAAGNVPPHGTGREAKLWQHIADTVLPNKPFEFLWSQPEVDKTRNSLEIWYDAQDAWLAVTLKAPEGQEFGPIEPGRAAELMRNNVLCGSIIGSRIRPNIRDNAAAGKPNDLNQLPDGDWDPGRHVILLELDPREATQGQWQVKLHMVQPPRSNRSESSSIPFHAWLERDDQGQSGIRRSTEVSWIRAQDCDATIGTLSCGRDAIVVAAYDTCASEVITWHQSARGPRRRFEDLEPSERKPDVSAPGVKMRLTSAGVDGACGHHVSGTSLAAPFVAGTIACLYQAMPRAPLAAIRNALFKTARKDLLQPPGADWDQVLGHGQLSPRKAVEWIKDPAHHPGSHE